MPPMLYVNMKIQSATKTKTKRYRDHFPLMMMMMMTTPPVLYAPFRKTKKKYMSAVLKKMNKYGKDFFLSAYVV